MNGGSVEAFFFLFRALFRDYRLSAVMNGGSVEAPYGRY